MIPVVVDWILYRHIQQDQVGVEYRVNNADVDEVELVYDDVDHENWQEEVEED